MAEVAELVGNLFKTNILPTSPEIVLPSQRQLRQLPLVEVMAVDPANPYEVDDAFAVVRKPHLPLELVTVIGRGSLIPHTSPEFAEALENGWSRYPTPFEYIPMISREGLVTHDLSLIEGKELRPGLASFMKILRNGTTRDHRIMPVAVKTTQKTYEQFAGEVLLGQHETILHAVDALRWFRSHKRRLNPQRYIETHPPDDNFSSEELLARTLVREIMIQYNKEMGRRVRNPYRPYIHRYTESVPSTNGAGTNDVTRAFYSPRPRRHEILGTSHYTHSGSPLRRAADLINQYLIEFELAGGSPQDINRKSLTKLTQHINDLIMSRSVRIGREF